MDSVILSQLVFVWLNVTQRNTPQERKEEKKKKNGSRAIYAQFLFQRSHLEFSLTMNQS